MIKYSDAATKEPYFRECCAQAFSLLRFSSLDEIQELNSDCKNMIAYILSNLSKLTAESKLFLDRLSKTYQNLYVPLLYRNCENANDENSKSYIETASKLVSKVEELVKRRVITYGDVHIDVINDLTRWVGNDINKPELRDAQKAANLVNSLYRAGEQISDSNERDEDELEAAYFFLHNKYKNTATAKASALKAALDAYSSVEKVMDSCFIAKIVRNKYSLTDKDAIVSFLDRDTETIIDAAADAAKEYLSK